MPGNPVEAAEGGSPGAGGVGQSGAAAVGGQGRSVSRAVSGALGAYSTKGTRAIHAEPSNRTSRHAKTPRKTNP